MNDSKPCGRRGRSPKRRRRRMRVSCSPSPQPSPRGEGERCHGAGKFECCSCSPRFFVFRFGGTRQPNSVLLPQHGRMFLPLLRERVGVRGNEANSNPKRTRIPGTVKLRKSPVERGFPNLILKKIQRSKITKNRVVIWFIPINGLIPLQLGLAVGNDLEGHFLVSRRFLISTETSSIAVPRPGFLSASSARRSSSVICSGVNSSSNSPRIRRKTSRCSPNGSLRNCSTNSDAVMLPSLTATDLFASS